MCGVIVVDAGRSRSTCLGRDAYIHDHALDIVITLRFSINCSTVICSPTILFSFKREASSETYGPRVYFPSYIFRSIKPKPKNTLLQFICFYFVLRFSNLLYLSLSDLILASVHEGVDNPFYRVGCKCLIVCEGA